MRGVSNAVSAVFVIAIILSVTYLAVSTMIAYSKAVATAQKKMVGHMSMMSEIKYGDVNVDGNLIIIDYEGTTGEYAIRLFCTDEKTHTKYCVVPTYAGRKSIDYWSVEFQQEVNLPLEYNVALCPNSLWRDLNSDGLLCYIIGEDSDETRYIKG